MAALEEEEEEETLPGEWAYNENKASKVPSDDRRVIRQKKRQHVQITQDRPCRLNLDQHSLLFTDIESPKP